MTEFLEEFHVSNANLKGCIYFQKYILDSRTEKYKITGCHGYKPMLVQFIQLSKFKNQNRKLMLSVHFSRNPDANLKTKEQISQSCDNVIYLQCF